MKSAVEVYEEIAHSYRELEAIPEGLHLFCPKVDDDDDADYDDLNVSPGDGISVEEKKERIQRGKDRLDLASWASLVLGIEKEQASNWLTGYIDRTESFLTKCDACVRGWHMGRKALEDRMRRWVGMVPARSLSN